MRPQVLCRSDRPIIRSGCHPIAQAVAPRSHISGIVLIISRAMPSRRRAPGVP
jgi:hypothetical protein